jgi:CheY-like chemotaxis protein
MSRNINVNSFWTIAVGAVLCCATVHAQQPAAEATEQLAPETNPAVLAALELPRTEPSHYVTAILSLIDLDRPELARPIFDELQKMQLSDAQRIELVRTFGTRRMLQLARTPALAPAGGQFADACLAAAAAEARDPQRLASLIQQLADPSPEARLAAQVDLESAGMPGVVAAVEAFGRETDVARRAAIGAALLRMHPQVVGPLVGMLASDNARLRADVAALLARLGVRQVAPLLPGQASERSLVQAIDDYRKGAVPFTPDEQDRIALWQWDDATKRLSASSYPARDARTIWMARLATALAELQPENRAYQRQALLLGLEAALPAAAPRLDAADVGLLSDVLADAMQQNYGRAAEMAAAQLGQRGDARVLLAADAHPVPLVEALRYPDRRVRFAALKAIMRINPQSPYPGSSYVPQALGYFAAGAGDRRAVVAMPTIERAANVAGRLRAAGIDAAATNRGAEAVQLAAQSPDLQLVLVDMDIQLPGVRDVLYALRIDPATGQVPIGLLAAAGRLEAAQALAAEHDRVIAFSRPHSDEYAKAIVDQLAALAGHNDQSTDERAAQSTQAIAWFAQLLADGPAFYDLRSQSDVIEAAALRPEATSESLAALAALGTPDGQRTLVDLASQQITPIATRRGAAEAFGHSVAQHGLLLTTDEILRQYDRYNASATADADTQQVLGAVLDSIEAPRSKQTPLSHAP